MSEASNSIHVWNIEQESLRHLLASARVACRIVATKADITTLLAFDPNEESVIVAHIERPSLKWFYYEDYGLGLELFVNGSSTGTSSFVWGQN